jgi:hypothetical protein
MGLISRVKLALQVLMAPNDLEKVTKGSPIFYDPVSQRLLITGDFQIHATGNLILSSDQHLVINSGNDGIDYTHQVHLNPPLERENDIQFTQPRSIGKRALQSPD